MYDDFGKFSLESMYDRDGDGELDMNERMMMHDDMDEIERELFGKKSGYGFKDDLDEDDYDDDFDSDLGGDFDDGFGDDFGDDW